MKEKERGGKMRRKKKGVKKKVPMRESNPRPLNLQTLSVAIVSPCMIKLHVLIIYISQI